MKVIMQYGKHKHNNNNYLIVVHPFTESSLLTQQTKCTRLLATVFVYTEREVKVEIVASSENLVFYVIIFTRLGPFSCVGHHIMF